MPNKGAAFSQFRLHMEFLTSKANGIDLLNVTQTQGYQLQKLFLRLFDHSRCVQVL